MKVEISVIVQTYRRPDLLERCLTALLTQRIDIRYEVIVVIDGPTEEIDLTAHRYSGRLNDIHIITMGKNCGPATARNTGFVHTSGDLIVFTDDDCVPDVNFLSAYWRAYNKANSREVAFTGKVTVPLEGIPTDYEANIKQLETAEFITANCAISRDAFKAIGGFDESYTMAWREDSDLHFRLLQHGVPIITVSDAIVLHPVRKAKWSVSLATERKNMFNALLYKKFPDYYLQKIRSKPPGKYYAMAALLPVGLAALFVSRSMGSLLLGIWIILVITFAFSRIRNSSKQPTHVAGILVTSALIPFLSVYWNLYGNIKFKSRLI